MKRQRIGKHGTKNNRAQKKPMFRGAPAEVPRTTWTRMPPSGTRSGRGGEVKGIDVDLEQGPIVATTNTNDNIVLVNVVQQGTGAYQRVGRKIYLRTLRVRGMVTHKYAKASTTLNKIGNMLRMTVVWDTQPGATIPAFQDIFGRVDPVGAVTSDVLDALQFFETERFKVLRDLVIPMRIEAATGTTGTEEQVHNKYYVDEFLTLNGFDSQYAGTDNPITLANITAGAIYLVFRAEHNTTTSYARNTVTLDDNFFLRLRYTD